MEKTDLTVLVVEDDEAIQTMYSLSLKKRFTNVLIARDGLEGWELFLREKNAGRVIPVVVTDAMMPRMDGPELMSNILKVSPATQIIIISGYYKSSISIHSARENVMYLPKPLDVMLLNIAVMKAFSHYPQALWLERLKAEVQDPYFNEEAVLAIVREAPWLRSEDQS
ncbi:MAG: response regulator transcription factor [Thermodesulfobacteriota bacterium]